MCFALCLNVILSLGVLCCYALVVFRPVLVVIYSCPIPTCPTSTSDLYPMQTCFFDNSACWIYFGCFVHLIKHKLHIWASRLLLPMDTYWICNIALNTIKEIPNHAGPAHLNHLCSILKDMCLTHPDHVRSNRGRSQSEGKPWANLARPFCQASIAGVAELQRERFLILNTKVCKEPQLKSNWGLCFQTKTCNYPVVKNLTPGLSYVCWLLANVLVIDSRLQF